MPSEDSKPAVKRVKDDEEEDDKMSLGSILKLKNGSRGPIGPNQGAKVKKDEPSNGGSNNSSEKKPIRKLKKEAKEEEEDDDDIPIGKKASSAKNDKAKVKKEAKVEDEDDDDDVPIGKKALSVKNDKVLNKKKVKEESGKKMAIKPVENGKKKRERKVYDLLGQKRDPPEERDPLRIFYESLYKQVPNSEMAQFWMMESGLLSKEEAKKVFEKKQKRGSPAKSAAFVNLSSQVSATVKKNILPPSPLSSNKKKTEVKVSAKQVKKRKDEDRNSDNDSDDDFVLSSVTKRPRAA